MDLQHPPGRRDPEVLDLAGVPGAARVVQIILQHADGLGEGISFLFDMTGSAATA